MIKRILALTDLSENSYSGLRAADLLARRFQAQVIVGYVFTRSDVLRERGAEKEQTRRLAEWVRKEDEVQLRGLVGRFVEPLRLAGTEILEAPEAREGVAELVARTRPDLVCMATRGRTGLAHLLLGSVAEHTIRTSQVPVVVTKGAPFPGPDAPLRVLLGLDLVDEPQPQVDRVASLLSPKDELVLAHVVESWYYTPSAYGTEFSLPQPDVPGLVEAARQRLQGLAAGAKGPRLRVEVRPGRPGDTLLAIEEAVKPHLVAVRTHGRRGFDRMMLGSVSEFLARRCRGAVLVLPK